MKKYFLPLLLVLSLSCFFSEIKAQSGPYGNEWIDYSKTYFKFKVGADGICQIKVSELLNAGMPTSVQGANLIMYRDGKEVPIYVISGALTGSDSIEFYGLKAKGLLDKELYGSSQAQANDRISLFTDTACYYLSYDNNTNHLHYQLSPLAVSGAPNAGQPAQPYLLTTVGNYSKATWIQGQSLADKDELVSSLFETGEGYVNSLVNIGQQLSVSLAAPNLAAGYPGNLHTSVISRAYIYSHQIKVSVNATPLADSSFGISETKHYDLAVPAAQLSANNTISFTPTVLSAPGSYDNYGVSFTELQYPRNMDLSGIDEYKFQLPNNPLWYLVFTNMGASRIYDIENGYVSYGYTDLPGKTRFLLYPGPNSPKDFVLVADSKIRPKLTLDKVVHFTDYSNAANQGDFVIISHPYYHQLVSGHDYVQDYSDYRKSTTGGGHSVVVANVSDLYDEFAYGYDIHPLSIKHFLKYALDNWSKKPQDVLLLGRGLLYNQYRDYQAAVGNGQYPYAIVPTYGNPGSDVDYVMYGDQNPRMRIGRVPAWTPAEVGGYLDKVKAYEAAVLSPAIPTAATELWKKRALHVVGSSDATLQDSVLSPVMMKAAQIIADTPTNIVTTTIAKSQNTPIQIANSALLNQRLQEGTILATFYGHGSENSFDYNLPNPMSDYTNTPHFPFFTALGCDVAQMFTLTSQKFLAERYILAPTSGSIAFLASDNVSFTGFDDYYLYALYNSIVHGNYGAPIGTHYIAAHTYFGTSGVGIPNYNSAQLESMIFSGDPSLKLPAPLKPDYAVSTDGLSTIPINVSTSLDTFSLKIISYNLAKAIKDSVLVKVEHINPKGAVSTVGQYTIVNLGFSDTSYLKVPISKLNDIGVNKYRVTIDANNRYDEVSELNNVAILDLFIYSDNLVPIYPKEFAIVNTQGVTLKASTLNVFRRNGNYRMEIDTTELFNSPLKQSTAITSPGGVIKWKPNITMTDSIVYYWRAAFDSTINGSLLWTNSSFVYLEKGSDGWNQSHYYQYQKDNSSSMVLYPTRRFYYSPIYHKLDVLNTVLGGSGDYDADGVYVRTYWDDIKIEQTTVGGVRHALQVTVIDSNTGRIWVNDNQTPGAANIAGTYHGMYSRQFDMTSLAGRNYAAHFIDSVPNGNYLLIRNVWWHNLVAPLFVDGWKADSTSAGGLGNTLYGILEKNGFNIIDSFNRERVFVMFRIKGDPNYPVYQAITDSLTDHISATFSIKGKDSKGDWNS
ncbi:MAG: C25 family cysteine peptidase, partial [Chitinophagaceae bacterium]